MHNVRILLAGLVCGALCAHGAGTLIPYTDGFEAYSLGPIPTSGPWMTNGTGSATVTNTPVYAGSRSCSLSDINLILDVDEAGGTYTDVYWRVYARPVQYEDEDGADAPTNCAGAAAAFYVSTNGYVKAYAYDGSSNTWITLSAMQIPSNVWVGFEVNINYGASNWNIWASTNGFVTSTKLNSSALQFPTNAANQKLNDVAVYNNGVIDSMMLYLPAAAGGGIGLPFFDGFEAYSRGPLTNSAVARQYWSLSGDEAAAIVTNSPYIEGVQSCFATNATLTLQIDENKGVYTNVWCQMYLKPTGYEDDGGSSAPSVSAGAAAAVYVSTDGWLRAYAYVNGGNMWTNVVRVSTSQWVGIAMHMDYATRLWDLYYTTNGYGSAMVKANTTGPLGIQTAAVSVAEIGEVVVQNNFILDAVGVSEGSVCVTNPPVSNTGKLVAQALDGGRTNLMAILAHHYASAQDTLAGALGNDLKSGLVNGDRIRVFWTNSWNIYTLVDGAWSVVPGDPGLSPSQMHITPGMGVWIEKRNSTNAVVFYPYDTIPSVTNAIYGTNYYWSAGWNLLGWPFIVGTSASSGWGFSSFAGQGDTIYMYNNGLYDVKLWWDAAGGRWMQGARASSYTMKSGQAFWYYRAAAGSNTWVVANPSP